ncbi:amino acid ABC transporter ATP-binding protein [Tatumella sp. TA1]|uniref:amino acid ABC transporter ATP-binding protein n=1 Tax=Rosenbergiella collisarenosi TaxID=1544695 RepID=UPI0008F96C1A|nr:amino acid ABC transporter ATP-binding protein [Rosenbergiella collisarenosi]MBT0721369.1 amino acid ABC transporter ATP-binding protein [Rosenbergiella collisarenosi]QGX92555.1 amino acid ABC transporter ATP-binding protein [Tatumella sp. TA1]
MISLQGINKYFQDNHVLKDISLTLPRGSVTALIGPSGSGKSTLLRCVNLLEIPQSGEMQLDEARLVFTQKPPRTRDIYQISRQTGMVFQNFALFPHKTVIENITEGLIVVHRMPKAEAIARAEALLEKVGLAHKRNVMPATLSGGQQQRVAIARALAPSPQVLLCDEPTSALDPELAAEVVAVLRQLANEGTTMLMATHDLRLAASVANQTIFLEAGEIVETGESATLFRSPQHARTAEYIATLTAGLPAVNPT